LPSPVSWIELIVHKVLPTGYLLTADVYLTEEAQQHTSTTVL
jgi:hypothetical protein